jgi:hypothetical protein
VERQRRREEVQICEGQTRRELGRRGRTERERQANSEATLGSLLAILDALLEKLSAFADNKVAELFGVFDALRREVRIGLVRVLDEGLTGLFRSEFELMRSSNAGDTSRGPARD